MIDRAEIERLTALREQIQGDITMVHDLQRKQEAAAGRLLKASQQIAREILAVERGKAPATSRDVVAHNITHNLKAISTIAFNMKQAGAQKSYSTTAEAQFAAIEELAGEALGLLVIQQKAARSSSSGGYDEAFFELAKLMDIPAQDKSPRAVWETQMLPKLREALSPVSSLSGIPQAARDYLEATERLLDWMNGNDLSAGHAAQKPDDFNRLGETLVRLRAALSATATDDKGGLFITGWLTDQHEVAAASDPTPPTREITADDQ